jgi:hypothetical protein
VTVGARWLVAALWLGVGGGALAQAADDVTAKPLPDVAALMQAVEAHEKTSDAVSKDYIYTSDVTEVRVDGSGKTKKTETTEAEIFYVSGVRLRRLLKKDGQALSADEKKEEDERIDKEIARAKKGDGRKEDEVMFARFLELGSFSNERRVMLRGRPTIALDYTGNPKAKTKNQLEGVVREMAGTVWVDEEDEAISRVEGRFANAFKIGLGLVADVAKGTSFWADSSRVNGEVWLPSAFGAQGSLRALVFFSFHGNVSGTASNYRKFKTGSTILPGAEEVKPTDGGPDAK